MQKPGIISISKIHKEEKIVAKPTDEQPRLNILNLGFRCRGVVAITTALLYSTKPEVSFCACSNTVCSVSKIRNGVDL